MRPLNGASAAPSTDPRLVAPATSARFQPNSSLIGMTNTVRIPMAVAALANCIPEAAPATSPPVVEAPGQDVHSGSLRAVCGHSVKDTRTATAASATATM